MDGRDALRRRDVGPGEGLGGGLHQGQGLFQCRGRPAAQFPLKIAELQHYAAGPGHLFGRQVPAQLFQTLGQLLPHLFHRPVPLFQQTGESRVPGSKP